MPTSITPSTCVTDGQLKQFKRLIEDAAMKAAELAIAQVPFDKDGLQRLFANGDEFQVAIRTTIIAKSRELSSPNQFADEEVRPTYGYLSGYTKPKSIADQVKILRDLFPQLASSDADETFAGAELPAGAEGTFAIPRWQSIAPTYGEAVQEVLNAIKQTRDGKFYNYIEGQLGPQYLRQHAKTVEAFQKLEEAQQGHDILVVPCQFGIRHRGRSVRRAREVMGVQEFGLGAFAVGIMILTHPERLQHYDDLWIDCAGDERSPGAGGSFGFAPIFRFDDGRVKFDGGCVVLADVLYGSVSGLLSQ